MSRTGIQVELVKRNNLGSRGRAPVGERYVKTCYFQFDDDGPQHQQARQTAAARHAFVHLKRDRPDENPMCWEAVAARVVSAASAGTV